MDENKKFRKENIAKKAYEIGEKSRGYEGLLFSDMDREDLLNVVHLILNDYHKEQPVSVKTTPHTLQEKTTAMEKAIRMAKEVHEVPERNSNAAMQYYVAGEQPKPLSKHDLILTTAKQIYDWLTA